ncbi:YbjN domain-containing protein [bacterium]|nr:YbjN domain-containing protein [bacterium]
MGRIMDTVEQYLRDDDWHYEQIEGQDILKFGIKADNSTYNIYCDIRDDTDQLMLYVVMGQEIPEEKRLAAAEYITRANYGLKIGNFEMDMSDGQIRYKVSLDVEDGTLSHKMIANMIGAGVGTMDRYFPGFMSISFAGKSPEDTINEIEGQ